MARSEQLSTIETIRRCLGLCLCLSPLFELKIVSQDDISRASDEVDKIMGIDPYAELTDLVDRLHKKAIAGQKEAGGEAAILADYEQQFLREKGEGQ